MDNLLTGWMENVRHLLRNGHFQFLKHDITRPLKLKVDAVYSLACPACPPHHQQDPVRTIQINVLV